MRADAGTRGHHLQVYRKISGFGAYVEGWALYAEQLADEMSAYEDQPAWEQGHIHNAPLCKLAEISGDPSGSLQPVRTWA